MNIDPDLRKWLEAANRRYGEEGTPHKARPFQAMLAYSREHRCSLSMNDPKVKAIFAWFYEHSPPDSHHIGSVFTGAFYFDAAFWPLHVPLIFGQVTVNPLDCLATMPALLKRQIESNRRDVWSLTIHWTNCMDYGYGQMELTDERRLSKRAQRFLGTAHGELVGAVVQLLVPRPNAKAILGLRMATEIFLKTVLVQECNLDDIALRKVSHKLEDAASMCADVTGNATFGEIGNRVCLFPPIASRYEEPEWPLNQVWECLALTQSSAAAVTRQYSSRNLRAQIAPLA